MWKTVLPDRSVKNLYSSKMCMDFLHQKSVRALERKKPPLEHDESALEQINQIQRTMNRLQTPKQYFPVLLTDDAMTVQLRLIRGKSDKSDYRQRVFNSPTKWARYISLAPPI